MTGSSNATRPAAIGRRAFAVVLAAVLCCAGAVLSAPVAQASPAQVRAQEWWISRLGLPDAWKITKGAGMTVAVIDSGVDTSVKDLSGATVAGFTVGGVTSAPTKAYDQDGHGTAMATYIAGRGTGPGIMGVAPAAKIMPVYLPFGDPPTVAEALNKLSAMAHPPQIVNMSFGTVAKCADVLQSAVARAVAKGMILVASAGNTGGTSNGNQYPSNCKGVVAVGAFDYNAKPWVNTQRQPYVSLGAPGVKMVGYNKDLQVGLYSGSSNAAALVSGEMALVRDHFPKLTPRQVVARLFATASKSLYHGPRYGQAGDTLGFGPGLPHQALVRSVAANAPNPVYDDLAKLSAPTSPSSSSPTSTSRAPESPSAPRTSGVNFPGTSDSPAAAGSDSSGSSNTGVIVAAIAGGVVIIAIAVFLLVRRNRRPAAGGSVPQ